MDEVTPSSGNIYADLGIEEPAHGAVRRNGDDTFVYDGGLKAWVQTSYTEDHERLAKTVRDWTFIEGGPEQEKHEEPMAQDPTVKIMLQAGRLHLESYPERTADDYCVKQAMATVAPAHTALQQMQALGALRVEFRARNGVKAG